IRGVESSGMVCSERELGLGDRHKHGIVVLPPDLPVGTPLEEALGLQDTILEVELTPNRGDCQSILGMAREVAALTGNPVRYSFENDLLDQRQALLDKLNSWSDPLKSMDDTVQIEIQDQDLCPRYSALVIDGLQLAESPWWLKWRLINSGVRPISNLVDVTNYVMLELGEPQHAFDRRFIGSDRIVVRRAAEGEKMTTLDGQERSLIGSDLVIADADKPVGLAGVMGGENSEIREDTTDIILEAAHFEPVSNRKTASRLGLRTEASARFEKYVDPQLTVWSLWRSWDLLQQIGAGGRIQVLRDENYWQKQEKTINLGSSKVQQLLGIEVESAQADKILASLGFMVEIDADQSNDWQMQVGVPSFRPDVGEEADLVEELARIIGFDQMGERLPVAEFPLQTTRFEKSLIVELKKIMKALGLTESYGYSMLSVTTLERYGLKPENFLQLSNPLGEFEFMQNDLLAPLLLTVERNKEYFKQMRLFSQASVFLPVDKISSQADPIQTPVPEKPTLAVMLVREPNASGRIWKKGEEAISEAKSLLLALLQELGMQSEAISLDRTLSTDYFVPPKAWQHKGRASLVRVDGQIEPIGWLGELNPAQLAKLELGERRVGFFQLDLERLAKCQQDRQFVPFSNYPAIVLDVSL
ncbi:MAG TPA: phenylalanine--tRNA ligase subunit beta, partial [Candidatus Wirthbacteria bacterium]|nr:phenylalanine--tRNA ligase subunit beta [Candidatus Wirthbacteria bacterium]